MVSFIPISTHIPFYRSYLKPIPTKNHGNKTNIHHFTVQTSYSQNNLDQPQKLDHGVQCKKINRSISAWDFIRSFPQHSQHLTRPPSTNITSKAQGTYQLHIEQMSTSRNSKRAYPHQKRPPDFCFVFFLLNMFFFVC